MPQKPVGVENQRPQPTGGSDGGNTRQDPSQSSHAPPYASVQSPDENDATISDTLVLGLQELDVNVPKKVSSFEKQDDDPRASGKGPPPADEDRLFERERAASMQYLLDNVAEFRELTEIRKKVSKKSSIADCAQRRLTPLSQGLG